MSRFEDLTPPSLDDVRIVVEPPGTVKFSGTIASRDPAADLAPFLRQVHSAAIEASLQAVNVDVTALTFVNSSAIRLFVDWTTWAKNEPSHDRYRLHFVANKQITWQKTTLMALQSLAPNVITVA